MTEYFFTDESSLTNVFQLSRGFGLGSGAWETEDLGTSGSGDTGPGTNSAGPYVISDASGGNFGALTANSTLTLLPEIASAWTSQNRVLAIRVCIMGEFEEEMEGFLFEGRESNSDEWETIILWRGWIHSDGYTVGENVVDYGGNNVTISQDGGWVDFEQNAPDLYTQFRFSTVGIGGATFRHDVAIWSIDFRDGTVTNEPPTITASAGADEVTGGQRVLLIAIGDDPEGQALTYSWIGNGGVFSHDDNAITNWTAPPATDRFQVFRLTVTVTDPGGLEASTEIVIRVRPLSSRWRLLIGGHDFAPQALERITTSRGYQFGNTPVPRAGQLSVTFNGTLDLRDQEVALVYDGAEYYRVWTGYVGEQSHHYDRELRQDRTEIVAYGNIARLVSAGAGRGSEYFLGLDSGTLMRRTAALVLSNLLLDFETSNNTISVWFLDAAIDIWPQILQAHHNAGPDARLYESADGSIRFRRDVENAPPGGWAHVRPVSGDAPNLSDVQNIDSGIERVINDVQLRYSDVGAQGIEIVATFTDSIVVPQNGFITLGVTVAQLVSAGVQSDDLVIAMGMISRASHGSGNSSSFRARPYVAELTDLIRYEFLNVGRYVGWLRGAQGISLRGRAGPLSGSGNFGLLVIVLRNAGDPIANDSATLLDNESIPNIDLEKGSIVYTMGAKHYAHTLDVPTGWNEIQITNEIKAAYMAGLPAGAIPTNQSDLWRSGSVPSEGALLSVASGPTTSVVWEYASTLAIASNQMIELDAISSGPFTDEITPTEAGNDYDVSAGSVTVELLDRVFADRVTIRLTAGVNGAVVTGLRLRAVPIESGDESYAPASDVNSIDEYGHRGLPFRPWIILSDDEADELVTAWVEGRSDPSGSLDLILDADRNEETRAVALGTEIGESIIVDLYDGRTVEGEMLAVAHEIGRGGVVRSRLSLLHVRDV